MSHLTNNELTALMNDPIATVAGPEFGTVEFDSASLDAAIAQIAAEESAVAPVLRVACPHCNAGAGVGCFGTLKAHASRMAVAGRSLRPISSRS